MIDGMELRLFVKDDVPAFATLLNVIHGLEDSPRGYDAAFLRDMLGQPGMDAEQNCMLAVQDGGLGGLCPGGAGAAHPAHRAGLGRPPRAPPRRCGQPPAGVGYRPGSGAGRPDGPHVCGRGCPRGLGLPGTARLHAAAPLLGGPVGRARRSPATCPRE